MDGIGSALAQSLRQQVSPVIMVLSTPRAEQSCQRNGLSFIDLLRPFCSLGNVNVPVRTASEQPYRLTEFHIRMFYSSEICQLRTETAEEVLMQLVNATNDKEIVELEETTREPELAGMIAEANMRTPAFQKYCKEFMRTLAFSEHEAVDHPVACILVVSSSDVAPVNKFMDLYNSDQLPAPLNDGTVDPKLLKLYVMLHDNQDGPVDRANELLLEMRSVFGVNNCRVLSINSASPEFSQTRLQSGEDLWQSHMLDPLFSSPSEANELVKEARPKRRGQYIKKVDVEELTDFVLDLSVKHVIPSMEVKIRTLYQQVSATRKGLKNQIKNLWWRKGKDDVPDLSNGPLYTHTSMESQIRVLADYAFMLRDYELALSNYRLLSSDYKTDKAWKRYAGVQEMIGLSLFMLDQSRRESELCMETAINYYQKGGHVSALYATRSAIWLAEMHKARNQYREAAVVLSRASTEEAGSRAGILLEQAAHCYLHTTPPMLRKYGFHLVLAGNQYANCFQRKLATNVYKSALNVLGSRNWNYIHDHVYFHLGRWPIARLATLLGNHLCAVQFFKRVIASSHQSSANQAKFLAEFLFVIQSTAVQGRNLELDLPTVDLEHVHVHFEDQRTYASSAAAYVPEQAWATLEEGLLPVTDKTASTWLNAKTVDAKQATDFNTCVAGEDIGVDVEFVNPLQISLDVSNVSLVCKFTAQTSIGEQGARQSAQCKESSMLDTADTSMDNLPARGDLGGERSAVLGDSERSFTVSEEDFSLKPGEKLVIRSKVRPLQAGLLKVTGVKWKLSGIAVGHRDFSLPGTKGTQSRTYKRDEHTAQQRLNFHVLGHMPRLDVSLHEMPGRVNAGEVRRLVLELSNPSMTTLNNIKIKTSHPLFLSVGEAGDLDQEFPGCLEVQREPSAISGIQDSVSIEQQCSTSGSTILFPAGTALEGASTLLWPLWLHAREAGTIHLNSVVYYEPDKSISAFVYRTVRMAHTLHVLPSLKVGVQITPSPIRLQQFLLRLNIENSHSTESFWLRQVSCAGNRWSLAPLAPPLVGSHNKIGEEETAEVRAAFLSASVSPSQLLPASQTVSLYFKLMMIGPGNLSNEARRNSSIKLSPPGSIEPFVDISSSPLPRFFSLEKLIQPKPSRPPFLQRQVVVSGRRNFRHRKVEIQPTKQDTDPEDDAVHVILISEQQDGMSTEKLLASPQDSVRVLVHNICHCSVQNPMPLVWALQGPRYVGHNFAVEPLCEESFLLTVRNCSAFDAFVRVETFDKKPIHGTSASGPAHDSGVGWFPFAAGSDGPGGSASTAAAAAAESNEEDKPAGISPCGPYMWCALRATDVTSLRAGASASIPLRATFFAPGTYDLSRYEISWSLREHKVFEDALNGAQIDKETVSGPPKQSKSTETTFAAGFAAVPDKAASSLAALGSRKSNMTLRGVGKGHPLLLTVLERQ